MIENEQDAARGRRGHHHGAGRVGGHRLEMSPIEQIAVWIDESVSGQSRLTVALHLAKALGAELLGLCVAPAQENRSSTTRQSAPGQDGDHFFSDIDVATRENDLAARSEAAKRFFAKMKKAPNIKHRAKFLRQSDELLLHAKSADLTILNPEQEASRSALGFSAQNIALACGRPVLIVPEHVQQPAIGESVVIAWDGSRESIRALHDAMPLMRDAAHILIVAVDGTDYEPSAEYAGTTVAESTLARHGFQVHVESASTQRSPVADALFEVVSRYRADLLVAGLFHHAPWREGLFGGVTWDLLRRCPVPVLVSH